MAGAEAEKEFFGTPEDGESNDRDQIALMMNEVQSTRPTDQLEARLRAFTRTLVRRPKRVIALVAKALLRRKTLSAAELDQMISSGLDAVVPNHPALKAFHEASLRKHGVAA